MAAEISTPKSGIQVTLMDPDSVAWITALRSESTTRHGSESRLHRLLMRVAYAEAQRRAPLLPRHTIAEFDDLCTQAADDALLAILGKMDDFQGLSRFTTWASKFVILEISSRLRRSAWRDRRIEWDDAEWERLEESAPGVEQRVEQREQVAILRLAMARDLTERQRQVLTAAVVDEIPIDVLAQRMDTSRGAIYKILHDARVKLRASLMPGQGAIHSPETGRAL